MSSIAKANISLSKKDLTKSRILPVASRNVVFYHKATMGDQTIDLLALSMPSEMPTQVQATNEEINDARLYNNKKNLALVSSSKGQLIQGLDYLVTSGYTINLIGPGFTSGAEADEIFIGTINAAPISDLAVASSKTIVKSYELPVGQTTLNLGREYKLSEDGVLKVFVNGVLAKKDSDYEEVDSGNGYGSVIEFFTAPATIPYQIVVDFGVLAITDSNAIGDIESLAGSVKKIADDLAIVAGTDTLDYLNANPSEVERRWFGDALLKMLEIEISIVETQYSYLTLGSLGVGNVVGALTGEEGSGLYSYNSATGIYTALKDIIVNASYTGRSTAAASPTSPQITFPDNTFVTTSSNASAQSFVTTSGSSVVKKDETFSFAVSGFSSSSNRISVTATFVSTQKIRDIIGV